VARGRSPRALSLLRAQWAGQFYFGDLLAKWINIQPALTAENQLPFLLEILTRDIRLDRDWTGPEFVIKSMPFFTVREPRGGCPGLPSLDHSTGINLE